MNKKLSKDRIILKKNIANTGSRENEIGLLIVGFYSSGHSSAYIKNYLSSPPLSYSATEIERGIKNANARVNGQYTTNIKSVTAIHTTRYNKIILDNIKVEEIPEDQIGVSCTRDQFLESRFQKKLAYDECLDAMQAKEKALMMHSPTFTITVTHDVDITIEKKKEIVISKLLEEEQIELLQLLQKTKVGQFEFQSTTPAKVIENKTEDIEAEVIETKINIDEIEQTAPLYHEPIGRLVADPTEKLRAALAKEAEQKLNRDNPNRGIKVIIQKDIK